MLSIQYLLDINLCTIILLYLIMLYCKFLVHYLIECIDCFIYNIISIHKHWIEKQFMKLYSKYYTVKYFCDIILYTFHSFSQLFLSVTWWHNHDSKIRKTRVIFIYNNSINGNTIYTNIFWLFVQIFDISIGTWKIFKQIFLF